MLYELAPELRSSQPGRLKAKHVPHLKDIINLDSVSTPGMFNFDALYNMGSQDDYQELFKRENFARPEDATNIQVFCLSKTRYI